MPEMNEALMNQMLHATEASLREVQAEAARLEQLRDALLEYLTAPRGKQVSIAVPTTPDPPADDPPTPVEPLSIPPGRRGVDDDGRHDGALRGSVQRGVRAILQEATRPLSAQELAVRFRARGFYSNARREHLPTQLATAARTIGAVKSGKNNRMARWHLPGSLHERLA